MILSCANLYSVVIIQYNNSKKEAGSPTLALPTKIMNYQDVIEKKNKLSDIRGNLSQDTINAYTEAFYLIYAYNSAAISGNSISFVEAKVILDDNTSIAGKSLNEVFELVNHKASCTLINEALSKGLKLNSDFVIRLYETLTRNIEPSHLETRVHSKIKEINQSPLKEEEMIEKINELLEKTYKNEDKLNPIERSVLLHLDFIILSPFPAYNGIIARMISNYLLMANEFLPISISNDEKPVYFNSVETYAKTGNYKNLLNLIYELESNQLDCFINMNEDQQ